MPLICWQHYMDMPLGPQDISCFWLGMDLLVPEVISLISTLGAMMVLIKARIHVIVPFIGRKNGTFGVVEVTAIALLCNVLCREVCSPT